MDYGEKAARLKLRLMLEGLELLEKQTEELERQMALTMAATNSEMKQLYHYLKTRSKL